MQQTDTDQVNWFSVLKKLMYSFLKFNEVYFYLFFSEELVLKLPKFAGSYTSVPNEDLSIIKNACQSVIYVQGARRIQITQAFWLFLFWLCFQLYRDDGLAVLPSSSRLIAQGHFCMASILHQGSLLHVDIFVPIKFFFFFNFNLLFTFVLFLLSLLPLTLIFSW